MSEEKKRGLSDKDIDRIIRKVANDSKYSKKEINEDAGSNRRENTLLKPWIRKNTYLVFGEDIDWQDDVKLKSMRDAKIRPDLVGKDFHCNPVIVEVKFKYEFKEEPKHLRRDPEDRSIGQILQYACAYGRKYPSTQNLRLFIVSIDFSKDVEDVCKFLRSKSINIRYISIKKILCNS